jgi:hypothetical protein
MFPILDHFATFYGQIRLMMEKVGSTLRPVELDIVGERT